MNMKIVGMMIFVAFVVFAIQLSSAAAETKKSATKATTLTGTFFNQGKAYPIKGVFTTTKDGQWTTVFTFTFGRRGAQVFKGTAEGKLQKGELKGLVVERRRFVFSGTWKKGVFSGKTSEYFKKGGKPSSTGTITLKVGDVKEGAKDKG